MLNITVIIGRLATDPELKTTQSGVRVTSFRVAVERNYIRQGEERQTDFFTVVAWRQTAEFICKYFVKGDTIAVRGRNESRSYTDQHGNNRTAYEIIAEEASFCGGKKSEATAPVDPIDEINAILDDNDLPF